MSNISVKDQWFRRRCPLKYSYLQLWWPFCLAERHPLCNFCTGHYEEHYDEQSCEIVLTLEEMSFKEKANGQTTDNTRRPITIAHQKSSALLS